MASERLAMRTIKELFRLRFQAKLSHRAVSRCLGCGRTTVQDYERRALLSNSPRKKVLAPIAGFRVFP